MSKKDNGMSRRQLLIGWRDSWKESWQEEEREEKERQKKAASEEELVSNKLAQARQAHMEGRLEEAVPLYREAVKIRSRDEDARRDLGVCLYQIGHYIPARVEFDRVLYTLNKDNTSSLYLGLCLLQMGKPEKAAAAWSSFSATDDQDAPLAAILQEQVPLLAEGADKEHMEKAIASVNGLLQKHVVAS